MTEEKNLTTPRQARLVTPQIKAIIEKLRPYDEEFGLTVSNLLDVVDNQHSRLYELLEDLKISNKEKDRLTDLVFQNMSLNETIKNKVDVNLFYLIDDLIFELE